MKRLVVLSVTMALAACGSSESDLTITNGTKERITSIQIAAGGEVWYLEPIEAGKAIRFIARVKGDGGPRVSWKWRDKIHAGDACYYSAGWFYGRGPQGRLRIEGSDMKILRCE